MHISVRLCTTMRPTIDPRLEYAIIFNASKKSRFLFAHRMSFYLYILIASQNIYWDVKPIVSILKDAFFVCSWSRSVGMYQEHRLGKVSVSPNLHAEPRRRRRSN